MYLLGVDIGGTAIKIGVLDEFGKIIRKTQIKTQNLSQESEIKNVAKAIDKLLEENKISKSQIKGVGVGCPGAIDGDRGIVKYSSNLKWKDFCLKSELESLIKLPVRLANDADAATLGEAIFGSAKGYKTVIMLTLGTGVGGGIVINKKLYEAPKGMGAELGHIVVKKGGLPCGCGRRGCLEQYASATALIRQTKTAMLKNPNSLLWEVSKNDINNVDGKTSFIAERLGDKTAKRVINNYISYLGEGLLDYCNIFRPDAIVIGGGISNEGEILISKLVKYLKKYEYGYKGTPRAEILLASLKNDAGIIGSGSLVMEL